MSLVVSARSAAAGPAGIMRRWLSSSPASSATSSASSSIEQHVFPAGFRAAGVRCGVKKKQGVLDFAAIASTSPCSAAAVFTTNKFKAGPVIASQRLLQQHSGNVHGVVINSGCANACTGTKGVADAEHMIALAARAGIPNALVMSTGVIGPFLPMDKIEAGLTASSRELSGSLEAWQNASRAIMTTDTVPKLLSGTFQLPNGKSYTIAGICKGAGMIHPNMATMLAVVCTDVAISPECLQVAVRYAADRSFNSISVDGDMSTNDSMAVLANGQANGHTKADAITSVDSPAFASFQTSLTHFSQKLAQKLVRDGEGATKFVAVQVRGGRSYAECKQVAQSIATSALVKTAMYGQDANWGRIVCAVGYSGVDVDPERVNLWFVDTQRDDATHNLHLLKNGQPFDVNEEKATALVRRNDIHVRIDLGLGKEEATVWTCDFSIDYVKINADYRS